MNIHIIKKVQNSSGKDTNGTNGAICCKKIARPLPHSYQNQLEYCPFHRYCQQSLYSRVSHCLFFLLFFLFLIIIIIISTNSKVHCCKYGLYIFSVNREVVHTLKARLWPL